MKKVVENPPGNQLRLRVAPGAQPAPTFLPRIWAELAANPVFSNLPNILQKYKCTLHTHISLYVCFQKGRVWEGPFGEFLVTCCPAVPSAAGPTNGHSDSLRNHPGTAQSLAILQAPSGMGHTSENAASDNSHHHQGPPRTQDEVGAREILAACIYFLAF